MMVATGNDGGNDGGNDDGNAESVAMMVATAIMVAICAPWVVDHTRRGTTMKAGPKMLLFEVGFFLSSILLI